MLHQQIVQHPDCPPTDFAPSPWNNTSLVTPQHAVWSQWNESAVQKHCKETGNRLFVSPAQDHINQQKLTLAEQYGVAAHHAAVNLDSRERGKR